MDVLDSEDDRKWDEYASKIFQLLDKEGSGFISGLELEKIVEAIRLESDETSVRGADEEAAEEALKQGGEDEDRAMSFYDLKEFLQPHDSRFLEDVFWFTESVIKVEDEIREKWKDYTRRWASGMDYLYNNGIASYQLLLQTPKIAKWVSGRISDRKTSKSKFVAEFDRKLRLGFSLGEVEVLFEGTSHHEVETSLSKVEPLVKTHEFLSEIRDSLSEDLLQEFHEFLQTYASSRGDAAIVRGMAWVIVMSSGLDIMTQMICGERPGSSLPLGEPPIGEQSREMCNEIIRMALEYYFNVSEHVVEQLATPHLESFSETFGAYWVGSILSHPNDYTRGKGLDELIKLDRKRFLGGKQSKKQTPLVPRMISMSVFCHVNILRVILDRLRLRSYHALHECRTPIRAHLIKFVFNILIGGGRKPEGEYDEDKETDEDGDRDGDRSGKRGTNLDIGRHCFREAKGMEAFAQVLMGPIGAMKRVRLPLGYEEEEWDFQDSDPMEGIPHVYEDDFVDDALYGTKDRAKVVDVLTLLSKPTIWGVQGLSEELAACPDILPALMEQESVPIRLLQACFSPLFIENAVALFGDRAVEAMKRHLEPHVFPLGSMNSRDSKIVFDESVRVEQGKNVVFGLMSRIVHLLRGYGDDEDTNACLDAMSRAVPINIDDDLERLFEYLRTAFESHQVLCGVASVRQHAAMIANQLRAQTALSRVELSIEGDEERDDVDGGEEEEEADGSHRRRHRRFGSGDDDTDVPHETSIEEDVEEHDDDDDDVHHVVVDNVSSSSLHGGRTDQPSRSGRPENPTPPSYYSPAPDATPSDGISRASSVPPQDRQKRVTAVSSTKSGRDVAWQEEEGDDRDIVDGEREHGQKKSDGGSSGRTDRSSAASKKGVSIHDPRDGRASKQSLRVSYLHRPYSAPLVEESQEQSSGAMGGNGTGLLQDGTERDEVRSRLSRLGAASTLLRPESVIGFLSPHLHNWNPMTPLSRPFSSLSVVEIHDVEWPAEILDSTLFRPQTVTEMQSRRQEASLLPRVTPKHPQMYPFELSSKGVSQTFPRDHSYASIDRRMEHATEQLFTACHTMELVVRRHEARLPPLLVEFVRMVRNYLVQSYPLASILHPSSIVADGSESGLQQQQDQHRSQTSGLYHTRLRDHPLLRSLLHRYPIDSLDHVLHSTVRVANDMIDAWKNQQNMMLARQLMGYFIFQLCFRPSTSTAGSGSGEGEMEIPDDPETLLLSMGLCVPMLRAMCIGKRSIHTERGGKIGNRICMVELPVDVHVEPNEEDATAMGVDIEDEREAIESSLRSIAFIRMGGRWFLYADSSSIPYCFFDVDQINADLGITY